MGAAQKFSTEDIIAKLDELPTMPNVVYELSRIINDPMTSTAEIEGLMSKDQSLTAKVLKLVNSAYYAIPGGVSSLGRAIAYLGYDTVNQLVLSASILDALSLKGPQPFDIKNFWKHSLGVAVAAEVLAKFVRHPLPSDLFTAGLVHDMGKVALLAISPDTFNQAFELAEKEKISYLEAEIHLEGIRHTTVGFRLAQKWHLPTHLQTVAKYHHEKDPALRGGLSTDLNRTVDIVFLANLLTHGLKFGNSGHSKILGAPTDIMARLGIDPTRDFKQIILDIKSALDRAQDFLRVLGF